MVRVKKRASKRMTLKQRAKIHKKVQEHGRKQRREARRNPQRKSKKEDPGIPNLFPYKEELLNEMEERRRLAAEQRMLAKEKRHEEEEEEDDDEVAPEPAPATPLARPPAPTLLQPFKDVVAPGSEIKAVVYVLDARDPSSFRRTWLEKQLRSKKSPSLALALAKADLVPSEVLTGWVYDLRRAGFSVFPTSVRPEAEPAGVDALAAHLPSVSKGAIAVLGLENVGKSALAAALQDALEDVQVYDSPSLVRSAAPISMGDEEEDEELSRSETQTKLLWMLMRNQGQVQRFKDPVALVRTLLPRVAHPVDLMMAYGTPAFGSFVPERATLADDMPDDEALRELERQTEAKAMADTEQFLVGVARSVGRLKRMGMPDTVGAARLLLRDWAHGGLGYYAMPQSKAKAVQANGSSQDKKLWADIERMIQAMDAVQPRKEWRQAWASKELRLKALEKAPYDEDVLVFAPTPDDLEEEDEDDEEDDDLDDEEDDEEDLDEEDDDLDDEEEDEDDEEDDEEDLDEEDDLDEEPIPVPRPSKKRSKAPMMERAPKIAKPTKEAPRPSKASRPAPVPPKRRAPAPGEAYDINAYF